MTPALRILTPPTACEYLRDRPSRTECEVVGRIDPADCARRIAQGWRRSGHVFFRPRCGPCQECRALRVTVPSFRPDRSQRRILRACEGIVRVVDGDPSVTPEKVAMFDVYHGDRARARGWTLPPGGDAAGYVESFVRNPVPTREWRYSIGDRLVGVGYQDILPDMYSAIYFFHDPAERHRGLGTYNVLCLIDAARRSGVPHVYLGYFVADCPSLAYKARFNPHQVLGPDGRWFDHRI